MPSSRPIKFTYTLEERLQRLQSQIERFQAPPSGDELTRALALGTWYSFFGDYGVYRPGVLRGQFAAVHKAATDYLIKLAATMGIDGTPLNSAGVLCRLLAKQTGLTDPEAETCSWPDCLGRHRYELAQGEQATIEAGERVIQKMRLKLGASPATPVSPEATAAADDTDDLLDEVCDSLRSPDHRCIVSKLWNRKRPTAWEDLAQECGTSSNDSAVKKSLQRLNDKLAPFCDRGVCLENNEGTKRVKIVHP